MKDLINCLFYKCTFLCRIGCRWRSCPWCKRFGYRFASGNSSCTCSSRCSASISCFCWWYRWCLSGNPGCCTSRAWFFGRWFSSRMLCVFINSTIMISFCKTKSKLSFGELSVYHKTMMYHIQESFFIKWCNKKNWSYFSTSNKINI